MDEVHLEPGGFRAEHFLRRAYLEAGRPCPAIDERIEPVRLLFPGSFVRRVSAMSGAKVHDFSFSGSLLRPDVASARRWVLDFALEHFTERSYLQMSDPGPGHRPLGPWDHSLEREGVWVPKDVPPGERAAFNPHYYAVLRRTELALCPAGDQPWSLRFFEAIMCQAIPVVAELAHTGRHDHERAIGYHVLLADDDRLEYDPQKAAENLELFLEHQTLIDDGKIT